MNEFLQYLSSERRYSKRTFEIYRYDLQQFEAFLKSAYDTVDFNTVKTPQIRTWLAELKNDGLSETTINGKLTALKSFYRYQLKREKIKINPTVGIVRLKQKKRLPIYVQERQIHNLLSEIYDQDDFESVRNRVIIEFFYATGARVSELINLKNQDIDSEQKTVKFFGKGSKERIVPLTEAVSSLLSSYQKIKTDGLPQSTEYLFVDLKNKPLTQQKVYKIVQTFLMQTPIDKRSPHVLRHTFATHLLNNGADLNAVKELLGHSSLAATQVYTHNSIEKLKQNYKTAHPRA
ncbi:MAG: tyrosine-type recombinase/integrase [Bacteroidales bacterium]|nr:tyrosine-type recombinase/integrase [Bacteroidales bacterium]